MSEKELNNVIELNVKIESTAPPEIKHNKPKVSNPIYKKLINLTHSGLTKFDKNYKSFSKFKPDDLI